VCVSVGLLGGVTPPCLSLPPRACLPVSLSRYNEAVSKYEAVMKTEPNVPQFSHHAKERICHALAQVRACRCVCVEHVDSTGIVLSFIHHDDRSIAPEKIYYVWR